MKIAQVHSLGISTLFSHQPESRRLLCSQAEKWELKRFHSSFTQSESLHVAEYVQALVAQFNLSQGAIHTAVSTAKAHFIDYLVSLEITRI